MSAIELSRRLNQSLIDELLQAGADCTKPNAIRCPFHDDTKPSAGIYQDDHGVWRFKCHCPTCGVSGDVFDIRAHRTGRTLEDVLRAERDAGPKTTAKPAESPKGKKIHSTREAAIKAAGYKLKGTKVAEYDYHDADGDVVGVVVRFGEPKTFRQVSRVSGGWITSKLKSGELYRLPQLAEASADSMVFVVEGEKDADRLTREGLIGTTSIGGAGNAFQSNWSPLHGRDVAIVPDADKDGRKYAREVAELLHGKAASVRIVRLEGVPDKGDVSDWFQAGGDAEQLITIAEETDMYVPDPKAESKKLDKDAEIKKKLIMRFGNDIDDEHAGYLWKRRLLMAALNIIFSRPGRGKSTIAADLTSHVTRGQAWPDGQPCRKGKVLYVKGEGSDAAIRDRMMQAGADPNQYIITGRTDDNDDPMIDLGTDTKLIAEALAEHPDIKLIIVDTLDSVFASMRMIDNGDIRKKLFPIQELAEKSRVCVVILAHTNKGGYADPLDRLSGGRAIGGAARSVWQIGKQFQDKDVKEHYMASVKCNDFIPAPTIEYQIVGMTPDAPGAVRWGETTESITAWDLEQQPKAEAGPTKSEQCAEWLTTLLTPGPLPVSRVKALAALEEFGQKAFANGKAAAGVKNLHATGRQLPVHFYGLGGAEAPIIDDDFNPETYTPPQPPKGVNRIATP